MGFVFGSNALQNCLQANIRVESLQRTSLQRPAGPARVRQPGLAGPNCVLKLQFQKCILDQYWDFLSREPFVKGSARVNRNLPGHCLSHLTGLVGVSHQQCDVK